MGKWICFGYLIDVWGWRIRIRALLLWLYYTAQIFLFGAEFTACLARVRDERADDQRERGEPGIPCVRFSENQLKTNRAGGS